MLIKSIFWEVFDPKKVEDHRVILENGIHVLNSGEKGHFGDDFIDGGEDPVLHESILENQLKETRFDVNFHGLDSHLDGFLAGGFGLDQYLRAERGFFGAGEIDKMLLLTN